MRPDPTTRSRLAAVLASMAIVLLIAACEGSNLFVPPTEGGGGGGGGTPVPGVTDSVKPTVTILTPAKDSLAKPVGDSVFVEVRVTDNVGVRSVSLYGTAARGDKDLGTDTIVQKFQGKLVTLAAGITDTTLTRYLIPAADSMRETVQIVVEATDSTGNTAADTVDLIVGGPDVQFLDITDGQTLRNGSAFSVRVQARDPIGVLEVTLNASGVLTFDSIRAIPTDDDTIVTFDLLIPATTGNLVLTATALNDLSVESSIGPFTLAVVSGGAGDVTRPSVKHEGTAPERMELQEVLQLDVSARDDTQGDGIRAIGYTILGIADDTVIVRDSVTYATPRTGQVSTTFTISPFNVDSLTLPQKLVYEVTTWAIDAAGNCGSARGADTLTNEVCAPLGRSLATGEVLTTQDTIQVQGRAGERLSVTMVAGRTVSLPDGGLILDAVVDPTRQKLYLSNLKRNRVEVFELDNEVFAPPIPVGSEPWGLALNTCYPVNPSATCEDTLMVANSGGTNISMIDLDALAEDGSRRLLTPDVILFEVLSALDGSGIRRYSANYIPGGAGFQFGWSDRPQFIARDSTGKLLYSTKTVKTITDPIELGTVRKAFVPTGGTRTEVVLFTAHSSLVNNPDYFAIANADSLTLVSKSLGDEAILYDHITGTTTTIASVQDEIPDAWTDIVGKGSDITVGTGRFRLDEIAFKDTTFVASSGDGGWVAIGEGDTEADDEIARIIMYEARTGRVSSAVAVVDRMLNDGEVVHGIGLNFDGTQGVARGRNAYFFTQDLRLQGVAGVAVAGAAGAVMHPLHADARRLDATGASVGTYHPDTHIAFIPTGEHTIDIYDTFHFFRSGRIFIRDIVIGPLRAALPFATDNAGLTCPTVSVTDGAGNTIGQTTDIFVGDDFSQPYDAAGTGGGAEDRCIVLKLYGPTDGGGVVVVNVRKSDILRNHPAR